LCGAGETDRPLCGRKRAEGYKEEEEEVEVVVVERTK
jgi:hypothetical protein